MVTEALGPFASLPSFFSQWSQRRDDRSRAALTALGKALYETKIYLRDREQGAARQQEREDAIVHLWGAAGIELRGVDSDLAYICTNKADYWINPSEWSEERISQRRIGIEGLYEHYRELLYLEGAVLEPQNKSLLRKIRRWLGLR